MKESHAFSITESTEMNEARRFVRKLAIEDLKFNEIQVGKISIVVTELATNLLKHAGSGTLIFRDVSSPRGKELEILCLDRGAGISNLAECMRDGYSTAGSLGTGLGAIKRLSSTFEINSVPGLGTAILSRHSDPSNSDGGRIFVSGAVSSPVAGEILCGDGWAEEIDRANPRFLLTDGLGHGPEAAAASLEAIRTFNLPTPKPPCELLSEIHLALRKTRGAAVAVVEIDPEEKRVRFSGIGNISGSIVNPARKTQNLMSMNGIAGGEFTDFREFTYDWEENSILILHSDGINPGWQLMNYPGLYFKHPSLIAGILYRDFRRIGDDATVLVTRAGK